MEQFELDSYTSNELRELGEGFKSEKLYDDAIKVYETMIIKDEKNFIPYLELGKIYVELRDMKRAIDYLQMAMELNPTHEEIYVELSGAYYEMGDKEMALNYAKTLYNINPQNYFNLTLLGFIYEDINDYEMAIDYFFKALKIDEKESLLLSKIGYLYWSMGKYEEAEEYLLKTIKEEKDGDSLLYLANTQYNLQKYEEAIKTTKIYLLKYKPTSVIYSLIADIFAVQNFYQSAIKYYKLAISLDDDLYVYQQLGINYFKIGEFNKSYGCFKFIMSSENEEMKKICQEDFDVIKKHREIENELNSELEF